MDFHSKRRLPCELTRQILIILFAQSIHTICTAEPDEEISWEMKVFSVLSSVSFAFREITQEIASRVFEVRTSMNGSSRSSNILASMREKLLVLRNVSVECQKRSSDEVMSQCWVLVPDAFVVFLGASVDGMSALVQAYVVWLICRVFERCAVWNPMATSFVELKRAVRTLHVYVRRTLADVSPREMAELLCGEMELKVRWLTMEIEIVQVRIDLFLELNRVMAIDGVEDMEEELIDEVKASINNSLEVIERWDLFKREPSPPFLSDTIFREFQLDPLKDVLCQLGRALRESSEYDDTTWRVEELVDTWPCGE